MLDFTRTLRAKVSDRIFLNSHVVGFRNARTIRPAVERGCRLAGRTTDRKLAAPDSRPTRPAQGADFHLHTHCWATSPNRETVTETGTMRKFVRMCGRGQGWLQPHARSSRCLSCLSRARQAARR
jgi:hypothetical protein